MPTRAYVYLPKKAIFFWSFKAATTSLTDWMIDLVVPAMRRSKEMKVGRPILSSPNTQIDAELAEDLMYNHGFKACIITRDPYSRSISGYVNKFVNYAGRWHFSDAPLEGCAWRLLEKAPNASFKQFLEVTADNAKKIDGNPHWWTQVDPKFEHLLKDVVIIDVKNLDLGIKDFCASIDMKCPQMKKTLVTPKVPPTLQGDLSEIGCTDLAIAQCIPEPHQLLTPATISLINDTYDIDFRTLGYAKKSS
jgi:hypothetical protein